MNLEMDLNIVICGTIGTGKSSTANSILGRRALTANPGGTLVTKVSLDNTCTYRERRITVVDTPGIHNTRSDKETIKKELARIAFLLKGGVHCFIICMDASRGTRFIKEEEEMLKLIKQDGQGNFFDYCMLAYSKAETEPGTCNLPEFLANKKEDDSYRRFLENIKDRVVAVNNKSLVPAEAMRNRDALINMVDVVVAENIRQGHPHIFTNDLFKAAGSLQEKLSSVVQDNSFHQVIVNATIEVVINNTSYRLPFDTFLKEVISILIGRESSEETNQFPDLFFTGTDRVYPRYVNEIHQIYDEIQPELNMVLGKVGYISLAAAVTEVAGAAVDKISRLLKL